MTDAHDRHDRDGTNDMDHTDDPTDRLAVLLHAAADAADDAHGAPVADADDLGRRIRARHARRTRVAGVAAALLLVTAGGGGFIAGRSTDDGGVDEETALATAAGPPTAVDQDAGAERSHEADVAAEAPETTIVGPTSGHTATNGRAELADPLFTRTLADGTVLDVRIRRYGDVVTAQPDHACVATGDLYVGVRAPDAVGQAFAPRFGSVAPGAAMVSTTTVGGPEGAPRWVVVAQAAEDVATIRATFADGSVDTAAAQEGIAVLASRSGPAFAGDRSRADELVVEALDAGGAVVARWAGDRWGASAPGGGGGEASSSGSAVDAGPVPETTIPATATGGETPPPGSVEPGSVDPATEPSPGCAPG